MAALPPDTPPASNATSKEQFNHGVRLTAHQLATGAFALAGIAVGTALAVGGLAPFITGGLTALVAQKWLENIGANALAGWLGNWGSRASEYVFGSQKVNDRTLLTTLATDLSIQMAANEALRADVELLLYRTDAVIIALDELKGQQKEQHALLHLIREDQRRGDLIVGRLHHKVMAKLDQIEDLIRLGRSAEQLKYRRRRHDENLLNALIQAGPFVGRVEVMQQLNNFIQSGGYLLGSNAEVVVV
jgi:hypothetical protein